MRNSYYFIYYTEKTWNLWNITKLKTNIYWIISIINFSFGEKFKNLAQFFVTKFCTFKFFLYIFCRVFKLSLFFHWSFNKTFVLCVLNYREKKIYSTQTVRYKAQNQTGNIVLLKCVASSWNNNTKYCIFLWLCCSQGLSLFVRFFDGELKSWFLGDLRKISWIYDRANFRASKVWTFAIKV